MSARRSNSRIKLAGPTRHASRTINLTMIDGVKSVSLMVLLHSRVLSFPSGACTCILQLIMVRRSRSLPERTTMLIIVRLIANPNSSPFSRFQSSSRSHARSVFACTCLRANQLLPGRASPAQITRDIWSWPEVWAVLFMCSR